MNKKSLFLRVLVILLTVAFFSAIGNIQTAQADGDPRRKMTIVIDVTEVEWWLVRWEDNSVACDLYIDHNLHPAPNEIYQQCGFDILDEWYESDTCVKSELSEDETCKGLYLHEAGSENKQKEIVIELPVPRSWIKLDGCESDQGKKYCMDIPSLLMTAEEPLPNEVITRIQGTLNEFPFICKGNSCEVKLRPTGNNGVPIEFWADSSYGDSTNHYKGRIRVAEFSDEASGTILPERKHPRKQTRKIQSRRHTSFEAPLLFILSFCDAFSYSTAMTVLPDSLLPYV